VDATLPIALVVVALVALVALVDGLVRRRSLLHTLDRAWRDVPRDAETGLLDRRACPQRIAAELKRAGRGGGSVWVGMVTVLDGDPDRFGRMLFDSLRVPEVAFRIGERVVCIARPDLSPHLREDLLGRIGASAPRERLAIGETVWRGPGDGDANRVLHAAAAAVQEVSPA
jgi:hypothetical protein